MHRNLSLFNKIPELFYSPDTPSGSPAPTNDIPSSSDKEDVIEFLGGDDEPTDLIDINDKTGKSGKSSKDKANTEKELSSENEDDDETDGKDDDSDDDELKELEKELAGPTDEQLELVTPVRRKEILKKYPELFKDFPYLEKAYYREQQFTELLPTIEDAKTAVSKAQTLDQFENELMGGSTENILKAIKEENPNNFHKIVDDYLGTLSRVDEQAYYHVL